MIVLNLDEAPFTPEGWSLRADDQIKGRVRGMVTFDPRRIKLHLEVDH